MQYYDYEYRIRYGDTDMMGISYYANYFVWFEAARTEYFRAVGLPYTECEKQGLYMPVVETSAKYKAPCTYDDLIYVRTSVSEIKISTLRFEYQVFNRVTQKLLTTGFSVHVCVDRDMRPARLPAEIQERIQPHKLLQV